MTIRVLIVDDEPLARERVRRLVREIPGVRVVGEAADGAEAIRMLEDSRPDIVFLDVRMSGLDGFEVVARVGIEDMPATVFVTAYGDHAVRAFDVHAVDYLLKPFDRDRFRKAFARARERIASPADERRRLGRLVAGLSDALSGSAPGVRRRGSVDEGSGRLVVRSASRIAIVEIARIDWIEGAGNYVRLYADAERHLMRITLTDLADRLAEHGFLRIHRSTIVNLDRIREIRHGSAGEHAVELEDGTRLDVGGTYRDRLFAWLER